MHRLKSAVFLSAVLLTVGSAVAQDSGPNPGPNPGQVPTQATGQAKSDELVRLIEDRASSTSFEALEAFGETALRRNDREGLNRLYHVFWILQNQGEYERAKLWNDRLVGKAKALRDQRYLEIAALNSLTGRYDQGDVSAKVEMANAHRSSKDWFVRAHAARLLAMALIDEGRIGEGLSLISQAETDIPDHEPYAKTAHAGLWEMTGMGLMKLHDTIGASIAFRRFEVDFSTPDYPRPDFDSVYNLADMALDVGDVDRAEAYYQAHRRLSLRTGLENVLIFDAGLCAKLENAQGDSIGVLRCLSAYGENLGPAAFLALEILPVRAIARARLGDIEGARRDRDRLASYGMNDLGEDRLRVVDAEILHATGQSDRAYDLLRAYYEQQAYLSAQRFSAGISQVTGDIQEQLDRRRQQLETARSNTELQRTIIRWQAWIVGFAIVFVISALLTLLWQWRLSVELRNARYRAEAANRAKTVFLANMSHEIRTPLNGVIAMADTLAQRPLGPEEQTMVEVIRSSGNTLERLLSDILDSARIESGQVEIEPAPFHLGEAMRDVLALWTTLASGKGVALTLKLDPVVEQVVMGDVVRLRQVLNNLISNALKFTARGSVHLSAEAMGRDMVRFTVQDTGQGFDSAQKARIFGRFQQADGSITREFGGTGLGLTISRELVQLMGGRLDCDSLPGQGSRFWFEIPLISAQEVSRPEAKAETVQTDELMNENAPNPEDQPQGLKVLLADDHPVNRQVVEIMLASTGAQIHPVENGLEAVEAFKSQPFDVVLMDMQMPVMDGLTAIRDIRQYEQDQKMERTPILMLTANALEEHFEAGRQAGADGHLTKPITLSSLFEGINTAMGQ